MNFYRQIVGLIKFSPDILKFLKKPCLGFQVAKYTFIYAYFNQLESSDCKSRKII